MGEEVLSRIRVLLRYILVGAGIWIAMAQGT